MGYKCIRVCNSITTHPLISKLRIRFPGQYETASLSNPTVSSAEVQNICSSFNSAITSILREYDELKCELDKRNDKELLEQKLERKTSRLSTLKSKFGKLVDSGDMEFKVGEEVIPAHAAIVWSHPISRMLQLPMREGLTKQIEMKDEDPEVIKEMITYFYTAKITITSNNAIPLLRLAALYEIESLRDRSCEYLISHITTENCLVLFDLAWLHEHEDSDQWKRLMERNKSYLGTYAQTILEEQLPLLCTFELSELHQAWPLLLSSAYVSYAVYAFVSWASSHWQTSDLCESITVMTSLLASMRNDTQEIQLDSELDVPETWETRQEDTQLDINLDLTKESVRAALQYFLDFSITACKVSFDEQCILSGFLQLDEDTLGTILMADNLSVASEQIVLDSIISWVQAKDGRTIHLPKLIECLRFPFIDISYLVKIPTAFPQVGTNGAFKLLLQEALEFQIAKLNACETEHRENDRRTRKRTSSKYQLPKVDASVFASVVSSAVFQVSPAP